jgi:hypothetical protein
VFAHVFSVAAAPGAASLRDRRFIERATVIAAQRSPHELLLVVADT